MMLEKVTVSLRLALYRVARFYMIHRGARPR